MNKNYIFNNMRISVLKDNILRFEYAPNQNYTNEETIFINKKKESNFSLDIHQEERIWFKYDDLVIVFDYYDPFRTLEIYKDDKRVYKYKTIKNSGELPLPNKTPYIFPVMDTPRIIIPSEGYSEGAEFKRELDTKDLFLLICKNDYKLLRKQFISLTGKNDMPRLKTLGLFNSRYYAWNEKSAKEMILKYKAHQIPLDNFVLDTDWRDSSSKKTHGTGYEVNTKLFPDIAKFYQFAHAHNVEVMMNDHPSPLGYKFNVFSPEEIAFRKEQLTKFLILGLDTWWYDRNWMVKLRSPSKRVPFESLGRYLYHDITRQFYQGLVLDPEVYVRPVTCSNITEIHNGGYCGIRDSRSHIYPFQWTGDINSDLGSLTNEVKNLKKCSNNMLSYFSSDIGGHVANPSKNEFIRWYQYGAFSPILRPHATCSVLRFREPWVFGDKTLQTVKEYINMRYRLLDVIYTYAYKNYEEGLSIFRAPYLNYPEDKKVYKEPTSYMLGDNILISPIGGTAQHPLKLKNYKGSVYVSFFDNKDLKGKPILTKRLKSVDFEVNGEHLYPEVPIYNFSARYKTRLKFDQDVELYVTSDDGVKIYIDDKLVLKDWGEHAPTSNYVATLKKDTSYKVRIEYFQAGGGAELKLSYAPSSKAKKAKIYLPGGEWYNVIHRNVYQGNRYIKEKYKVEELPLFVKAGTLLPLYKYVDNISKMSLKNIIYDYYPSRKVETSDYFYEDDGLTTGYQVGLYRKNKYDMKFVDDHYEINLYKSENNLDDRLEARNALFKMHVRDLEKVIRVEINDTPIRFKRHDHNSHYYPFSASEWSRDSKTCCFKFRQEIKKDYKIKIFVE